jgi:hypothetical protein
MYCRNKTIKKRKNKQTKKRLNKKVLNKKKYSKRNNIIIKGGALTKEEINKEENDKKKEQQEQDINKPYVFKEAPKNKEEITKMLTTHVNEKPYKLTNMFQVVCKNPDNCLALGPYAEPIKLFFENFNNWSYVDSSKIKTLGEVSANGAIIEIPFTKNGYTAYTVLKCAKKETSDNLFYEYIVGDMFINSYLKQLPCFVETYGIYEFKDESSWTAINDAIDNDYLTAENIATHIISGNIRLQSVVDYSINESCKKNKLMCALIQHFDKFMTFGHMWEMNFDAIKYEILHICWQVYFCLEIMGSKYTHYDLHQNNVCLYKPYDGNKYTLMRYHYLDENNVETILKFKSEFIVKIIDYGRNYFDKTKIIENTDYRIINTKKLVNLYVKNAPDCRDRKAPDKPPDPLSCGRKFGYGIIQGSACKGKEFNNAANYWIDPTKPNMSHDLRFARIVSTSLQLYLNGNKTMPQNDRTMLQRLVLPIQYGTQYGTQELDSEADDIIRNIYDMVEQLKLKLHSPNISNSLNIKYDNTWTHAATMDIYEDGRDYEFIVIEA